MRDHDPEGDGRQRISVHLLLNRALRRFLLRSDHLTCLCHETSMIPTYNRIVAAIGRILALDLGKKRIGLALSDELGLTAQGLKTLEREGRRDDIEVLRRLTVENNVKLILMGDPLHMSGETEPSGRVYARIRARTRIQDRPADPLLGRALDQPGSRTHAARIRYRARRTKAGHRPLVRRHPAAELSRFRRGSRQ